MSDLLKQLKVAQHDPRDRQLFAINMDQQNASTVVVSCDEYERYIGVCEKKANPLGFGALVPAGSDLERQARASGRTFQERTVGANVEFHFDAGQECFGHRVPTQDPRLMHFDQATHYSVTNVMRRNAKPWRGADYMEKFHEESDKRDELLRREGLT